MIYLPSHVSAGYMREEKPCSRNQVNAAEMQAGLRGGVVSAPRALRIERGARTGQPIIISLDSTELGPALGGCRHQAVRLVAGQHGRCPAPVGRDDRESRARRNALRRREGSHRASPATPAQLRARRGDLLADVGEAVESFDGSYITGPDVGTSPEDMAVIGHRTRHVLCRPQDAGGSGDS